MIGSLRDRITIQRKVSVINESGFNTDTWEEVCRVWAFVEPLRGREYFTAAAVQAERTVRFTIRYRKDIDAAMRIDFNGKLFNIVTVGHLYHKRQYTEIQGQEVTTGGG